jgi:hypothetical protein
MQHRPSGRKLGELDVMSNFSSEDRNILAHHILALSPNREERGKKMVGKNI